MVDALRILAAKFARTPLVASREMRRLFELDRDAFCAAAIETLRVGAAGPGEQYALTLLVSNDLVIDVLLDPARLSLGESCDLAARVLATMDSFLDVKLLRVVTSHDGNSQSVTDSAVTLRALEIVGAISDGCRVMTLLSHFLAHPDGHIRSKAGLLIGRINHNLQWAMTRMDDPDARVRANAIESLWGVDSVESRRVFRSACGDPDNRVAGNGALGLYRSGDLEAAELLEAMLKSAEPRFRAAAAWAMGETEDPRFLQALTAHMNESDAVARRQVFSAISKLRHRMKQAKDVGILSVFVTHIAASDSERRLELTVCNEGRRISGLAPVNVVLADTGTIVHRFCCRPRRDDGTSAVGFILPRFTTSEDPLRLTLLRGLQSFLNYKRKLDPWAALRYSRMRSAELSGSRALPFQNVLLAAGSGAAGTSAAVADAPPDVEVDPVLFSSDPRGVVKACECSTSRSTSQSAQDATRRMVEALSLHRGNKVVYIFGRDLDDDGWLDLWARVRDSHVAIHAVALDGDIVPELRRLCEDSGGSASSAGSAAELASVLPRMAAALSAGYAIRYPLPELRGGPIKVQVYTAEGFGEDTVLC